jgi:diacylglycerol kinase (ATP)
MAYTTVAIIYNPNSTRSGKQLARKLATKIQKELPKQKVELIETEHAGHGEELAYKLATASKRPLIISASGDGGYHDIVNGVMKAQHEGHQPTTGLLPAGNANDHYHNLHTGNIVNKIGNNESVKIDLLKLVSTSGGKRIERYAHSYIGFGLTPLIGNALNQTKLNPMKETLIVLWSLFIIKPVYLQIDNEVHRYESVVCSNVDVMSKILKISRPSSVVDGKFEVTIFNRRSKFRLILVLLQAWVKGVKEDTKVSTFSLKTVNETLIQADGEIIKLDAGAKVRITIEPQTLRCVI